MSRSPVLVSFLRLLTRRRVRVPWSLLLAAMSLTLRDGDAGGRGRSAFSARPAAVLNGRQQAVSTLLSDGRVLRDERSRSIRRAATAEIFDPTTGAWTSAGVMTLGRVHHTSTLLRNGRVLVAGGTNDTLSRARNSTIRRRISGSLSGELSFPRAYSTATLLETAQVLLAGGNSNAGYVASGDISDPATNQWTPDRPR